MQQTGVLSMERAVQIRQTGGPDVIEWTDVELAAPGRGEVRMRNLAVGLNFIDTYHRGGLYPMALPSGLGMEAAGIIEAVGEGVTDWRVGDRVATFGPSIGAYATARNIAAHGLFLVPDDISDEIAAAGLLKGCTTEFLVERCAKVETRHGPARIAIADDKAAPRGCVQRRFPCVAANTVECHFDAFAAGKVADLRGDIFFAI